MKDGKVWSAVGKTSGIDLAAEFARVYFDKDVIEGALKVQEYRQAIVSAAWMVILSIIPPG